ncbi:MAG: hypothetical protein ACR2PL_23490 [Dehalococcoidia bacterium]
MKCRMLALLVMLALGSGVFHLSGADPSLAQTGDFPLAPEEAVIAVLPYELTAQELPDGYVLRPGLTLSTPSIIAATAGAAPDLFSQLTDAGYVLRLGQALASASQPSSAPGTSFFIILLTDTDATRAYATGASLPPLPSTTTQLRQVDLAGAIGDASAAWHGITTLPNQDPQEFYLIRWQRGRLAYSIQTPALPLGQARLSDVQGLAASLDGLEATRPAPSFGPLTVTPPAGEQQRYEAALRLRSLDAGPEAAPNGYSLRLSDFRHPAGIVAISLDPTGTLHQVDEQWKRLVEARQFFANTQDPRIALSVDAALDVDPDAAIVDINDFVAGANVSVSAIAPPLQLGDATTAHRISTTDANGNPIDGLSLAWLHGPLLIGVTMSGPAGTTSMDTLAAFAEQAEARYQASPLASALMAGPTESWAIDAGDHGAPRNIRLSSNSTEELS